MEKYREDIKTIIEVLVGIACFLAITLNLSEMIMWVFWPILILASLYEKLLYFSRSKEKELRVFTHTDIHHRMGAFTFGGFIMLFAIGLFVGDAISYPYLFVGGLVGSFIFTNGIFYIPSLILKIEHESLHISGPKENVVESKQILKLKKVISIEIKEEEITVLLGDGAIYEVGKLDLNEKWIRKTKVFLSENLNIETKIN